MRSKSSHLGRRVGDNSSRATYGATEEARVTAAAFAAVMATTLTSINNGCNDVSSGYGNCDSGGKGEGNGNGNSDSDSNGDGNSDGDGDGCGGSDREGIGNGDGNSNGV